MKREKIEIDINGDLLWAAKVFCKRKQMTIDRLFEFAVLDHLDRRHSLPDDLKAMAEDYGVRDLINRIDMVLNDEQG